jgi:hypothetical protein
MAEVSVQCIGYTASKKDKVETATKYQEQQLRQSKKHNFFSGSLYGS